MKFAILLPTAVKPAALGGGYLNTVRFGRLLARHAEDVRFVSYKHKEDGCWFLPEVQQRLVDEQYVIIVLWGSDVNTHVRLFHGRCPLLYYHQGIDFGVELPPDVPILCFGSFLMAHAQEHYPANPLIYMPAILETECRNLQQNRDIDVLVITRKQPAYVSDVLPLRLRDRCRVHIQNDFLSRPDLFRLFNRSKVYLYAFAPQRTPYHPSGWRYMEGFATQTLEAAACGCTVLADLRGGHVDVLEPWVFGYRLMAHSPEWDVHQILRALARWPQDGSLAEEDRLQAHYDEAAFHLRAEAMVAFLERYYAFAATHPPRVESFGVPAPLPDWRLLIERTVRRLYLLKLRVTGRRRVA